MSGGVGLSFALLVGCSDTSTPPFELVSVNPSTVYSSVETQAVVEGKQFYDSVKVRLNDDEPSTIDHGWVVSVDNDPLQRNQTRRIDSTSLSIVLPAGLSLGTHDLSATDPRGRTRTLFDALTVVADSNTTVPNATGGATSTGSGGTRSISGGASSGSTLLSSGGIETAGGTRGTAGGGASNTTSGGTDATGGAAGMAGSGAVSTTSGGTQATGGIAGTAGSRATTGGGTQATGGINGTAGAASTTSGGTGASPRCGNGICELTESVCNCPSDCPPPACGDAGLPEPCDANDLNLVGCYRFESSARPGQDDSQYGNHATSTGVSLIAGLDGKSASLGLTSEMLVAKSPSLDVSYLTIEMWVRLDAVPAGTRAGLIDNDGQYGLFVQKSGVLRCTATGDAVETTAAVDLLVWTHVACTYDGANVKIFINGIEQARTPWTDGMGSSGTTGMSIGSNNPSGENLVGLLDDLRIWNVARTPDQICEAAHICAP